jgi:hypothetical protein
MQQVDQPGVPAGLLGESVRLVDAATLGVFAYDTRDVMGAGDTARVMVLARRKRQAMRRIRRAGFRVHGWTPRLVELPYREANMAMAMPGVVMWRSHDPAVSGHWFSMPH